MEHLRASNRPLGAYEIARRSCATETPLAPNQVYRVLARLAGRGEVQHIKLLSAYLPAQRESTGFLVCRHCRSVESFDGAPFAERIGPLCEAEGFAPAAPIIEVLGLCPECAGQTAAALPEKPAALEKPAGSIARNTHDSTSGIKSLQTT